MLGFCSADISKPLRWDKDKEGIPPNITKEGPTPVDVSISCSQSVSDPQKVACELGLYQRVRNPAQPEVRFGLLKSLQLSSSNQSYVQMPIRM